MSSSSENSTGDPESVVDTDTPIIEHSDASSAQRSGIWKFFGSSKSSKSDDDLAGDKPIPPKWKKKKPKAKRTLPRESGDLMVRLSSRINSIYVKDIETPANKRYEVNTRYENAMDEFMTMLDEECTPVPS